jgi:hypothetical protein
MLTRRMHLSRALVEARARGLWWVGVWCLQGPALQVLLQVRVWRPVVGCPGGRLLQAWLSLALRLAQGLVWRLELATLEVWMSQALESQVRLVLELGPVSGWTFREASTEGSSAVECRRPGRGERWSSHQRCGCPGS